MTNYRAAYELLAEQLAAQAIDIDATKAALKQQRIETPSWGYANSGTRFKAFAWPGAATTTRQKLDDAARHLRAAESAAGCSCGRPV